jgi:hypothetical protein
VRYGRLTLQAAGGRTVRVYRYPNDALAIFRGPRRPARYSADGRLLDDAQIRAA